MNLREIHGVREIAADTTVRARLWGVIHAG